MIDTFLGLEIFIPYFWAQDHTVLIRFPSWPKRKYQEPIFLNSALFLDTKTAGRLSNQKSLRDGLKDCY